MYLFLKKRITSNVAIGTHDRNTSTDLYDVSSTSSSSDMSLKTSNSDIDCKIYLSDYVSAMSSRSISDDSQDNLSFMSTKMERLMLKHRTFSD